MSVIFVIVQAIMILFGLQYEYRNIQHQLDTPGRPVPSIDVP